jgi:hypothetical protein
MKDVILRHYPQLTPSLEGMPNAFLPWHRVSPEGQNGASKLTKRFRGIKMAAEAINA